jgi:hypothetical protein
MKNYFKVGKYYSYYCYEPISSKKKIFLVLNVIKTDEACSLLTTLKLGENLVRTESYSIFNLPKEIKMETTNATV